MLKKEVKGKCVMILRNARREWDIVAIHVFEDEDGLLYWSSSPEHLGIRWYEGVANSLEQIAEEAARWSNWQGAWRSAEYIWSGELLPPRYKRAEVELWTEAEEREFWIAFAAAGGVAAEANRRRGARLVDDSPDSIESYQHLIEKNREAASEELRLASLRALVD
ncbi:MAG: hypothetical protein QXT58_05425 [Archaeoglobaceae archaeon]